MENLNSVDELDDKERRRLEEIVTLADKDKGQLVVLGCISNILTYPAWREKWGDYISALDADQQLILDNEATNPEDQYKAYEEHKDKDSYRFAYMCLRCSSREASRQGNPEAQYRTATTIKTLNNLTHKYLRYLKASSRMGEKDGYPKAQKELAEYTQSEECTGLLKGDAKNIRAVLITNLKKHNPFMATTLA